jgi:8-oxo-dGTP pyrophosphatase MutT (NUDIX family)
MKSRSYQLYDEQGRPLAGVQGQKSEVLQSGLLHAASHVWLWRRNHGQVEVLVQRRAATMLTYPNLLDVSAAGHIDGGEDPLTTAVRETKEEVNVNLTDEQLLLVAVVRCKLPVGNTGMIENEFQWLYLAELAAGTGFKMEAAEVAELIWKPFAACKADIAGPETYKQYVPHGQAYFATLFEALDRVTAEAS